MRIVTKRLILESRGFRYKVAIYLNYLVLLFRYRIRYCKVFRMLTDRGILPCIIRVLLGLYLNNMIRVAWNGILSDYFLAVNGVKQGGVLSAIIFSVYIDGLLVRLMKARFGCHIGSYYVGVLAYADDIVLFAPSPAAMRQYAANMLINTVLCLMEVSLNV